MKTKYFNDGLIGNKRIKATFTKKGELIRLFYGAADYKQFIDFFYTGVKINDSSLIYLHSDVNNIYSQEYIKDTNVLNTGIFNSYFSLKISQTDFVPINENFLIRKYKFKNENNIDLKINFLAYSKILTNSNNETGGFVKENALIQYNHDFSVCTFSNKDLLSKQVNGVSENIMEGIIGGKDYIGMSPDSAISYDLGVLKPNEETEIVLYIYINKNKNKNVLNDLDDEIRKIRNKDASFLLDETIKYWREYVKTHDILDIKNKDFNDKIKKIYNRTILLFPILVNETTGGISAGIEVDENKTKCGRYSYCWTRDAVFVTEAFDILGMQNFSDKFYSDFCRMTQSKNGMWEQRFFTDGRLAPCWGYQIDETASVVFGIYAHYKNTRDIKFLKTNLKMLEKAIDFLKDYIKDLFEENGKFKLSYDLWEQFEGNSLYSISSIYAAFNSMIKIYYEIETIYENNLSKKDEISQKISELDELKNKIKEYCQINFYDEKKKSYVRNNKDKKIDISTLGSIIPFKMFDSNDKKVQNTIERINMTLRTYTGGYIRYEDDSYMGGYNPWPIATLWMAWYYLEVNDVQKALEAFSFVTNSASGHGFLGEQVSNEEMKPNWVIGLTWSHAMYIIILQKLMSKK